MGLFKRVISKTIAARKVLIKSKKGAEVVKCWLSEDCTVRAKYKGSEVALGAKGDVIGVPNVWAATWESLNCDNLEEEKERGVGDCISCGYRGILIETLVDSSDETQEFDVYGCTKCGEQWCE